MGEKLKSFILLLGLLLFSSCIPSDGLKGKRLIKDFTLTSNQEGGCGVEYYLLSVELDAVGCIASCPEKTHTATSDEVASFKEQYMQSLQDDGQNLAEEEVPIFQDIDASKGLCLDDEVKIERPTGEVYINRDFCACLNGKPDILNNCESYCSEVTSSATSTLYGSVSLGPNIELNELLGNLYNWCYQELGNGEYSPACNLEIYDGQSYTYLPLTIANGSNTFSANITNLSYDRTYVARIIENASGSNAVSDSFQFRRSKYEASTTTNNAPLKIMPVSQYTCVRRSGVTDGETGNEYYDQALKFHYYFAQNNKPAPLEGVNNYLVCHDIAVHGPLDSILYDRLELIPLHFSVWDQSDTRFFDLDLDNAPDINKLIQERLFDEYSVSSTISMFNLFTWPNRPDTNSSNVGFYMQAFIDSQTGRSICPRYNSSGLYYSDDPIFKILEEVVGVNTEGIYMAAREGKTMLDSSGNLIAAPIDVLIIREGLLKKIWFYFENAQHYVPDEVTATQKTIHFYWPPDPENPYIQKSTQDIYTVRAPEDIGQTEGRTGLTTGLKPPDKKFGCIPAID